MHRKFIPLVFGAVIFFLGSCEKCKRCSYTYTVTTIEQTVNGEEEVVTTKTDYVYVDGEMLDSECIKGDDEFTIEGHYISKGDTTVLDNYEYTCTDL